MKLYTFQTVPLSIIRSLFTEHSAMVDVVLVCRQLSSRTWSCSKAVYKPVWHIPLLSVQWINSWWWTEELSGTCRVSCQNKFVKLVHLVGFIIKKYCCVWRKPKLCCILKLRIPWPARRKAHNHMFLRCTVQSVEQVLLVLVLHSANVCDYIPGVIHVPVLQYQPATITHWNSQH